MDSAEHLSYLLARPDEVASWVDTMGGYEPVLGAEASKAETLKQPADAAALLASRALLRLLLSHELGTDPRIAHTLPITRHCPDCGITDHGQPRHPQRAVSLSRTRELVLAAVGPANALLGVDVERGPALSAPGVFPGFDDTVLSPGERVLVASEAHPDSLRLSIFSAKEALLKATGEGLRVDPSSFEVGAAPLGVWVSVPTPGVDSGSLFLQQIQAGDGHVATLACSKPLKTRPLSISDLNKF
ncbi:4'-phosphopantetheinyl transferase family protein [Glutamicibacter sp. NPDC087344]|uniref:4'-phosphopantetheinyl transferase family protein n=1 Tax=Glutamicibacter sp. NPDC087344 TaxID=3363994 RepID=UPI003820CF90